MNDERIVEQFKLLKRAKKLEEMGSIDRALELYMQLHDQYNPNTSDAYERPAIILERKKKYEEALSLCHKAIEQINNDKMSGTVDKFEKRIDHIEEKLKTTPVAKDIQVENSYTFGIIGFRTHNKAKTSMAIIFYIAFIAFGFLIKSPFLPIVLVALVYLFTYFVDIFKAPNKTKPILGFMMIALIAIVVYSSTQLPDAFDKVLNLEDKEEHLEGGENIFKEENDLPVITQTHIADAQRIIDSEIEVIESLIIVNGSSITFGLILQPQTDKEKAIRLSEDFVEILAHQVSKDTSIKAPGLNSLGELYDYYSITISAGSDVSTILAKGTKGKSSKFITWRD